MARRRRSGWGKAKKEEIANREIVEGIIDFLEIEQWRKYPVGLLPVRDPEDGSSWAGPWPWTPSC